MLKIYSLILIVLFGSMPIAGMELADVLPSAPDDMSVADDARAFMGDLSAMLTPFDGGLDATFQDPCIAQTDPEDTCVDFDPSWDLAKHAMATPADEADTELESFVANVFAPSDFCVDVPAQQQIRATHFDSVMQFINLENIKIHYAIDECPIIGCIHKTTAAYNHKKSLADHITSQHIPLFPPHLQENLENRKAKKNNDVALRRAKLKHNPINSAPVAGKRKRDGSSSEDGNNEKENGAIAFRHQGPLGDLISDIQIHYLQAVKSSFSPTQCPIKKCKYDSEGNNSAKCLLQHLRNMHPEYVTFEFQKQTRPKKRPLINLIDMINSSLAPKKDSWLPGECPFLGCTFNTTAKAEIVKCLNLHIVNKHIEK